MSNSGSPREGFQPLHGPSRTPIIKSNFVMLLGSTLNGKVVDGKFIYDNEDRPTDLTRAPFEFYEAENAMLP